MASPADLYLRARYHDILAGYRDRTAAALAQAFDELDGYTEDNIPVFEQRVAPLLTAAKAATVSVAAAQFALSLGMPVSSVSPAAVEVAPRLRDPFLAAWHAVAEGRPWEEAQQAGRSQAEATGFNFVQSVSRQAAGEAAKASGRHIDGWERVPGAAACDWCDTVAGQLYHSADSADFGHDRCDCVVVPA